MPVHVSRRNFLLFSGAVAGTLAAGSHASAYTVAPPGPLARTRPQKALVAWYGQTGHTEGYAGLIGRIWAKNGLAVDTRPLRYGDAPGVDGYDLIAIGTPVHYMDAPKNVREWVASLPPIPGVGVAAFTTYGGKGDGQHNAAVSLLAALAARGGVPLGMASFGNMSAYPPTWSMGNEARTLKFRHKPDKETYNEVRRFAAAVLAQYGQGRGVTVKSRFGIMDLVKGAPARWMAGLTLGAHTIDASACVHCGACVRTCPAGVIDIETPRIDTARCLLCFGCLNNCPAAAHKWTTFGKPLYSFAELLKRNNVTLLPPPAE